MRFFSPIFPQLRSMQKVRYLNTLGESVGEALWWHTVRKLAIRVFGDSLDVVWSDMGGNPKHLKDGLSREDRWHHALEHIRAKGKPRVGELLHLIGQAMIASDDTTVLWETWPHDLIGDRHRK